MVKQASVPIPVLITSTDLFNSDGLDVAKYNTLADTDVDLLNGDVLTIVSASVTSSTVTTRGTVTLDGDQLSYTAPNSSTATETITYIISDRGGKTATATVKVQMVSRSRDIANCTPPTPDPTPDPPPANNDAPIAVPDTICVVKNRTYNLAVMTALNEIAADGNSKVLLKADSDPNNGDTISLLSASLKNITSSNSKIGSVSVSGANVVYKSPDSDTASEVITYVIKDSYGATSTATVKVSVVKQSSNIAGCTLPTPDPDPTEDDTGPNLPPVAVPDSACVVQDKPLSIPVLTRAITSSTNGVFNTFADTDPNRDTLSLVTAGLISSPITDPSLAGNAVISGDAVQYKAPKSTSFPSGVTSITETVSYRITDPDGETSFATIKITVANSCTGVTPPTPDPTPTPPPAANNSPIAVPDTICVVKNQIYNLPVMTTLNQVTSNSKLLLKRDSDPDGDTISLLSAAISTPATKKGNVVVSGNSLVYKPGDDDGNEVITYTIRDVPGDVSTATVKVVVLDSSSQIAGCSPSTADPDPTDNPTDPNDAPIAVSDSVCVVDDKSITIPVLNQSSTTSNDAKIETLADTDADGDVLTIRDAVLASTSILDPTEDGVVTFTSQAITYKAPKAADFPSGTNRVTEQITYSIQDPSGATATARVRITVLKGTTGHNLSDCTPPSPTQTNSPPIANNDRACVDDVRDFTLPVLVNDTSISNNRYRFNMVADSDPDGDELSLVSASVTSSSLDTGATQGSATVSGNNVAYTAPDVTIQGTEVITYYVQDSSGNSSSGTATVLVVPESSVNGCDNPTVTLSASPTTGTEAGQTQITLRATTSAPVTGSQTVNLGVSTAASGVAGSSDFSSVPAQITIANGQTSGSVTLTIVDDTSIEGSETGTFTISSPSSGLRIGATTTATVAITDNDFVRNVTIAVSPTTVSEGDTEANRTITVTVTADGPVSTQQKIKITTTGSAFAADLGLKTRNEITVTIPAGQSSAVASWVSAANVIQSTFTIVNDASSEGTETATFTLSDPSSGLQLGSPTAATLTITDND